MSFDVNRLRQSANALPELCANSQDFLRDLHAGIDPQTFTGEKLWEYEQWRLYTNRYGIVSDENTWRRAVTNGWIRTEFEDKYFRADIECRRNEEALQERIRLGQV